MTSSRGVEVGNIFKLGTRYSESLGVTFLDRGGKTRHVIMGSYGIGSGRLLACIAEEHNDDDGLLWPITVAPYHVHLVALRGGEEKAEDLYIKLQAAEVEVLYDDREESAGVKFNDADLIGIPIRLTVAKRSLEQGGVELKLRAKEERHTVALDDAVDKVREIVAALEGEIRSSVAPVTFSA